MRVLSYPSMRLKQVDGAESGAVDHEAGFDLASRLTRGV